MKSITCVLLVLLMLMTFPFSAHADASLETGDHANSWRYHNGILIDDTIPVFHSDASHPGTPLKGIDVSHHQGEINWEKVKADGVDFAIIRCGYGMDLPEQDDRYFEYNVSECERLSIPYGIYIYSYADSTERASSEADHVLRLIQGHTPSYPIFYDMEDDSVIYVGNDVLASIAATFCEKITAAGYPVGVYANAYWWKTYLTDPVFDQWYRWVAHYSSTCGYQGEYSMWQYSCTGNVDGISEKVDLNYQIGYPADHGIGSKISLTTDREVYDFLDPIYVSTDYSGEGAWVGMYRQGDSYGTNGAEPVFRFSLSNGADSVNIRDPENAQAGNYAVGDYTIVLFQDSGYTGLKKLNISITKKQVSQDRIESTCAKEGSVTTTFSDGSADVEILPKLPHTEEPIPGRDATCTQTGLTAGIRCIVCDSTTKAQEEVAMIPHSWDEGIISKEPTQTEDGELLFTCQTCGATNSQIIHCKSPSVLRLSGTNRFETAIKVAEEMKLRIGKAQFDSVLIASGTNFADALSGSYLSVVKQAPILLSFSDSINQQNADYIHANLKKGGTVYILGGTNAVPASMEAMLSGLNVKRLAGSNRFETNLMILKEAGVSKGEEILVCTSSNFADSLSASATGKPILLVYNEGFKLFDNQKNYLNTLKGSTFTILGGTNAVSKKMADQISQYGTVSRLAGNNRFETSVMVAEKYFDTPDSVVLAYAWNYPDGLCGGALANAMCAPLILTMPKYEDAVTDYAYGLNIKQGIVLGGDGLISDNSVQEIFDLSSPDSIKQK